MAERPASPLAIMAERPSLEGLLKDIPLEKLDQPCRHGHLSNIALSITKWKSIAPSLGLTEAEEENIEKDCGENETQKIGMLRKWKERFGRKATYRKLAKVFWELGRTDLVEKMRELLQTESKTSSSDEDSPLAVRSTEGSYVTPSRRGHEDDSSDEDKMTVVATGVTTMSSSSDEDTNSDAIDSPVCDPENTPLALHPEDREDVSDEEEFYDAKESLIGTTEAVKEATKTHEKLSGISVMRTISTTCLDQYSEYLKGKYSVTRPKFLEDQWPPHTPTRKVFNLAIIGHETIQRGPIDEELVQLRRMGSIDGIMGMETTMAVKLDNIFSLDKDDRKVILIEGAPGAGKSTLAWHVCRKWQSGELFQEFKIIIFVQLRNIQSASSLADILPAMSESIRREVLSEIQTFKGRDVLFVLDGWDEYREGLEDFLFQRLICSPGDLSMHLSSLIITSRPIASGDLQRYVSSRVEIVGFTSAELNNYFIGSIGDRKIVKKLQDHLRERTAIEASCYLPLNAAIVVHLFLALKHTLPHTLHEVFKSLVLCSIKRHLERQADAGKAIPDISSLHDLPSEVKEPFNDICTMAYDGVMENKATFSATDLQSFNLPTELSTLSLIQGVQSFRAFEQSVSYNFLHLSVQELLAAIHISTLSKDEQIQIFDDLFDQPRLAAVFQFYAAVTKLQTEGVRDIVARIVREKGKPLLVNLLHGLYEAQDPSLCQFVAHHLNGGLDLSKIRLSPMDCLVVGYFLSCVCLTTSGEFNVNLTNCSLDDYSVSFLVRGFPEFSSSTTAHGCLAIDLSENSSCGHGTHSVAQRKEDGLHHRHRWPDVASTVSGADSLAKLLTVSYCLTSLELSGNKLGDSGIASISDSLKANATLKRMSLHRCRMSEKGGKAIGDALMVNRSLQVLDMSDNPISAGVVHIAESLKCNCSLLEINLSKCGITKQEARSLAISLKDNHFLQTLILMGNYLSKSGTIHIAKAVRNNNCLKSLDVSCCSIGDKGIKSLGSALEVNSSLEKLILSQNDAVTGVGLMDLGESLKRNRQLKTLLLSGYDISDDDWKQFILCVQNNNDLIKLETSSRSKPRVQEEIETVNRIRRQNHLLPLRMSWKWFAS